MVRDYPRLSAIATACLERCRSAILEIMVIGPLRIERRSTGGETTHNHVGDDGARLGEVEGGEGRVHGGLPQILPSPQEFRIDRADLVERCAQLAKIVDQSGNLQMSVVGHVVSSRSPAGLADGQIPLRAVSRSVDAVAVRSTAALVSLDQCAAQHLFDRWQIAHKSATASAQGRCGKVLDHHRTESRICPIESTAIHRSTPTLVASRQAIRSASATRAKASMINGVPWAQTCWSGGAQSVHSRGIATEPRSGWRRLSVSTPETRRRFRTTNR